ncbi:MAG: sodium-dependent transporter [Eubacteriales bacterium]|jgi:NSS family neurotransmitter:Na+ symporter
MLEHKGRGQFASNLGFILAAAGSAVGLGNIWKFPYLAGQNGGGAFVLVYLILVVVMGFTIMLGEMAVGRAFRKNCVGSYRELDKRFSFVGGLGIAIGFIILSYYSVIGGWVGKYIMMYLTGAPFGEDVSGFFKSFVAQGAEPVIWHLIFMGVTVFIVGKGVSAGIEKASKFMMPALFILLIIVAVRSCTLPGAWEGVKYFVIPDFSKLDAGVVVAAMGQVFFSLSLGMGITCTYGSYLSKDTSLERNALIIPGLDSLAALISGFAVIPAVFAVFPGEGAEHVGSGASLMFQTLPLVFDQMSFGNFFGLLFFILVAFAAVTSSVALLEGTVAYAVEEFKIPRVWAVTILGSVCALLGVAVSLSQGAMEINAPIWNLVDGVVMEDLLDFLSYLTDNLLLPFSGLMTCLAIGWVWGVDKVTEEVEQGGKFRFHARKMWDFSIRFFCPVALVLVFLNLFGFLRF